MDKKVPASPARGQDRKGGATPGQELMHNLMQRRQSDATNSAKAAAAAAEMSSSELKEGGGSNAAVIAQLKNNLINTSAELLLAKSRSEEASREKEKLYVQIAELQQLLNSAQAEARSAKQNSGATTAELHAQVARLQSDVRAMAERGASLESDLERERTANANLRQQLNNAQRDVSDRDAASSSRVRQLQTSLDASNREKEELAGQVDRQSRTIADLEASLDVARREADDARRSAHSAQRSAEERSKDSTSTLSSLTKAKSELSAQLAAAEATIAQLRGRLENTGVSSVKLESEVARLNAVVEQASSDRDRLAARWKSAEERASVAESTISTLRNQLAEATTSLNVERAKAAAAAADAAESAKSPTKLRTEALVAGIEAESALVLTLRKQLREYEQEKEAVADLLATFMPMPSFVRDRAHEASAVGVAPGEVEGLGTSGRGLSRSSAALSGILPGSSGEDPHSILGQLRSLANERPQLIDALTYLDLQARQLKSDKERLSAGVEAGKNAEAAYEQTLSGLRRQLATVRSDLAATAEARDAVSERLAATEGELRARSADLAAARESLDATESRLTSTSRSLEDSNLALSLSKDECEALRSRIEALRSDYESQLDMDRRMKEAAIGLAAAKEAESNAVHAQAVAALHARVGGLEGELDAARSEIHALYQRLQNSQMEADRARAEASSLSHKLVQTEMALAQAEANHGEAMAMAREAESARSRTALALEETASDRDDLMVRCSTLGAEVSNLRSRVAELEAATAALRDAEERASALRSRLSETENSLDAVRTELTSANQRLVQVKEQARVDYEIAQQGTARVAAELQRVMKQRQDDADTAAHASASTSRSLAQLQAELQGVNTEATHLRERCRSLQSQLSQLASEAQEQRDVARHWHEEALKAKMELQTEIDRSASLNRALLEQLETVKADFYAFLALTHPEEAVAALGGAGAAALARTANSGRLGTSGMPSATHLVSSIASDMADLKKRLEGLVSSTAQASTAARLAVHSASNYRPSPSAVPAAMESAARGPMEGNPSSPILDRSPVRTSSTPTQPYSASSTHSHRSHALSPGRNLAPSLPPSTTSNLTAQGAAYLNRMLATGGVSSLGATSTSTATTREGADSMHAGMSASARLYSGLSSPKY